MFYVLLRRRLGANQSTACSGVRNSEVSQDVNTGRTLDGTPLYTDLWPFVAQTWLFDCYGKIWLIFYSRLVVFDSLLRVRNTEMQLKTCCMFSSHLSLFSVSSSSFNPRELCSFQTVTDLSQI